jgi:hypothetical protein
VHLGEAGVVASTGMKWRLEDGILAVYFDDDTVFERLTLVEDHAEFVVIKNKDGASEKYSKRRVGKA